jgi:hypothetical protein
MLSTPPLFNPPSLLDRYGFQIANTDGKSDTAMLGHLTRLFNCFDVCDSETGTPLDKMDWKALIFALKLCRDAYATPLENLTWGFALYIADGAFDIRSGVMDGLVSRHDVASFVSVAGKDVYALKQLRHAVSDALVDCDINEKAKPAGEKGKLLFGEFQQMLAQPLFTALFAPSSQTQFLVEWEELYHPVIRDYLYDLRLEKFNNEKVDLFRVMINMRRKFEVMQMLVENATVRQRARNLIQFFCDDWREANMRIVLARWQRLAMVDISTVILQRIMRGHIARVFIWHLRGEVGSAVSLQAVFRSWMCQKRLKTEFVRRFVAARKLQRVVRGKHARWRARLLLIKRYAAAHLQVVRARRIWEKRRLDQACRYLQRMRRGKCGRRVARHERHVQQRSDRVLQNMEANQLVFSKNLGIYMHELKSYYVGLKAEADQHALDMKKVEVDKLKLLRLRRRRKWEAHQLILLKQRVMEEETDVEREHGFNQQWQAKVDAVSKKERVRLERVLAHPETGTGEKEERKAVLKKIKARAPKVYKREVKKGFKLEMPEADVMAREEVLEEYCAVVKVSVEVEWGEAKKEFQKQDAQEKEIKQKRADAVVLFDQTFCGQTFLKLWNAWQAKVTVRNLVKERYTRQYDTEERKLFYQDVVTAAPRWDKPRLMGPDDIAHADRWLLLQDRQFQDNWFFYNPGTLEMSWEMPLGELSEEASAYGHGEGLLRFQLQLHMCKYGHGWTSEELVERMFYEADEDRNGYLDPGEFRALIKTLRRAPMNPRMLERTMKTLDPTGRGHITLKRMIVWFRWPPSKVMMHDLKGWREHVESGESLEVFDPEDHAPGADLLLKA